MDRPLDHIAFRFAENDIPGKANGVPDTLVPVKEDSMEKDGTRYRARILPYRTAANAAAGAAATFTDITDVKKGTESN